MKLRTGFLVLIVGLCVSTAVAQTMMPLPPYGNTYSGNVRGYWFTAPVNFTIVGLRVPDEQNYGLQSVEVVRFNNNTPPPAYPGTTNDFVSLARFVDQPSANILAVNIPVAAGEVIGIYGQCGTRCSYGTPAGPFQTEILGQPTTLTRSGMQYTLNSGPMHDIWQEAAYQVSRVEMYYIPEPASLMLLAVAGLVLRRR